MAVWKNPTSRKRSGGVNPELAIILERSPLRGKHVGVNPATVAQAAAAVLVFKNGHLSQRNWVYPTKFFLFPPPLSGLWFPLVILSHGGDKLFGLPDLLILFILTPQKILEFYFDYEPQ